MNIINITNLFRAYFIENKKILLIYCLVTFAVAILGFALFSMPALSLVVPYFILIWVAGTFFQSSLKSSNSTHAFNLPVTTAEKFIHAITVILALGIALAALLLAGAYMGAYLIRPLYTPDASAMHISSEILKMASWDFAFTLSIFLFGSIYFKKNAFAKMLVTMAGVGMGVTFYILGLMYVVFRGVSAEINYSILNIDRFAFLQNYYFVLYGVLILFFLSLTYLRLRETEV